MKSAKQALLAAGRIAEVTRGRISNDNHAWLQEQYEAGERFTDWPKGKVVKEDSPGTAPTVRVVRDANQSNVKVVREYTILYDEKAYKAVSNDGKEYGMREVCNTCRVSLVQNSCMSPTILGNIPVTIRPRA